jgi:1-acyl-sn-glycerol-3-phosphate acyltransferase
MTPRPARPTPLAARYTRLARLTLHLVRGLWIVSTRYNRLPTKARHRELQRWSRRLLTILNVHVRHEGLPEPLPERCMIVLNHVSWLDIFAVYAVVPGVFVAKSEIARWPLVGTLVARVGTLFIERGSRAHVRRMNHNIAATMAAGEVVCVCPEGTTTSGRELKAFHAALLQPALDAAGTVQPLALRYVDAAGVQTEIPAYVGEQSLLESMWAIASARRLGVELLFADAVPAVAGHRRELARECEDAIARRLGVAPPHKASGRAADPPDASPSAPRPTHSPYPAPEDQAVS